MLAVILVQCNLNDVSCKKAIISQGFLQDDNATGFINYARGKFNGVEEKYKVEKSIKIEKTRGEEKVAPKGRNFFSRQL